MERTFRTEGSEIELGGITYRITAVEGMGASAIAYRAEYTDALTADFSHHVFIKELFPATPHGEIYRDESGDIRCTADGEALLADLMRRFEEGNRANLALLGSHPGQVSGNLNSYRAYGTYYSVLSVHGGENLQTMLTQGHIEWSLAEIISVMNKLLDALECFHRSGYLHLDISPDNILLLPYQALLIDYNSIWDTRDTSGREFSFSEKAGYSAPEVCLRHLGDISAATDLYSVCAVFFRLLAGRPLSEKETMGNGLRRCYAQGFAVLAREDESVRYKTYQILARGLHTLPRKRYQDISQLREDFALLEQMVVTPELMAKDSDELYALVYDNLLDSLHKTELESKSLLARQKKRQRILQATGAFLIVCLLCGTIALGVRVFGALDSLKASEGYTEEEQNTIDRMVACLEANVGTVCLQITAQQDVLTLAASADVLAGESDALIELDTLAAKKAAYIQTLPSVSLSDDLLTDLIAIDPDFPTKELAGLCLTPDQMEAIAMQALSDLSCMIGTDDDYTSESKRLEIVKTYQDYLDAYTEWLFYTFDYVLVALAPEDVDTILNDSQYVSLFKIYYRLTGMSNQNASDAYNAMQTAANSLSSAQTDMTACGYDVSWE